MTIKLDDLELKVFGDNLSVKEVNTDTNTTTVGGLTRTEVGYKKWQVTATLDYLSSDELNYIKSVSGDIYTVVSTYKGLIAANMRVISANIPQVIGFQYGQPVFCGWTISLEERGSHV